MTSHPRTIAEIVDNYNRRKEGLRKALIDGAPREAHIARPQMQALQLADGSLSVQR